MCPVDHATEGLARRSCRHLLVGVLAIFTSCALVSAQARTPPHVAFSTPLRAEVMRLLEDLEQTRMLLGITLWDVHDLRNFALYRQRDVSPLEQLDRDNLRLYETLKPLDYAASSLLAALDMGEDRSAPADLAFLRGELSQAASQVLANYQKVAGLQEQTQKELVAQDVRDGLHVNSIPGKPWEDPIRERQRNVGALVGWRTNMEPPADFREAFWNRLQHLDIRYQLNKGRMIGIDFVTFKDPVLRWDNLEPRDGVYDFAAFDRMMQLAVDHGMRVRLVLPTMGGRVPDWWLKQHPDSVIRDAKGECDYFLSDSVYSHDFMSPWERRNCTWYQARAINLGDDATRERFTRLVRGLAEHCRKTGFADRVIAVDLDLFYTQRHWRTPPNAERRPAILEHYRRVAAIVSQAFPGTPMSLEVTDGEAHGVNEDLTAHEWRSLGLTRITGMPAVSSETPFFEDVMRSAALQTAGERLKHEVEAGPFFFQNCEYGFGTMLSINYFTSLLRDGLWSEGWFGPEGPLRWGYFPQVFTWNDRQLQWSGITNGYLAHRQAHLLSATIVNTRVTPADVVMLLPSSSMDVPGTRTHRELVGWGWALTALKVPYDIINEAQLAASGVPARAKLLILPQAQVLNDEQVKAIRGFVERGGILLASNVPGTDGTRPSPLADVLGAGLLCRDGRAVPISDTGVRGTWLQVTIPRGMHSGRYTPVPLPDAGYPRRPEARVSWGKTNQPFQALAPTTGKTMASYGTGEPAIVEHRFGQGRTLTLGYPYGQELMFADLTSIAFGKVYNGWARDEQMLGMIRWLRDTLDQIGYVRTTSVPEAWRHRLQQFEAAASGLSYPKGDDIAKADKWAVSMTYLDDRPDHRIKPDHDEMDCAAELTWRDRPGVATRYLAVGNRESAYGGDRGIVQFWMMPHIFGIRIDNPAIKRIYDIAAGVPVSFERDPRGVSFKTSVPPALGRLFAISTSDTVDLFEPQLVPGIPLGEVAANVRALAAQKDLPAAAVLGKEDVFEWLAGQRNQKLLISYGEEGYRAAAEQLAALLKEKHGIAAEITAQDMAFARRPPEGFNVDLTPTPAQAYIGNSWSNNLIAMLDATWPYNERNTTASISGRFSATCAWPGGERGFVTVTRRLEYRRADHTTFPVNYGDTRGYAPVDVNGAPDPWRRQRLLVLASTPAGACNAVNALARGIAPAPSRQ